MGKNRIKYLVFMFILIFSFNVKVNAIPTSQLGEEGVKEYKELSCLYKSSFSTGKVMLTQDKSGKIVIYKNVEDKSFEDTGWYVTDVIPMWGDVEKKGNGDIKINVDNMEDDVEIKYLTSCPAAQVTVSNNKIRFYKDKVVGDTVFENFWWYDICRLEKNEDYVVKVESNEYNDSSFDVNGKTCDSFTTDEMWDVVKYTGDSSTSCLYAKDVDEGCHIIRLDVDSDKKFKWTYAEPLSDKGYDISFWANDGSAIVDSLFGDFSGNCPNSIFVSRSVIKKPDMKSVSTSVYFDNSKNIAKYNRKDQKGINLVTGEELTDNVELNFQKIEILDCETLFGGSTELVDLLKFILNLIKVLVPLLLVGLGTLDFAKAILAGSEDNMKKAQSKFIKRVIIAVAIFLVPSILKLILGIASSIWGNIDADLCGLL